MFYHFGSFVWGVVDTVDSAEGCSNQLSMSRELGGISVQWMIAKWLKYPSSMLGSSMLGSSMLGGGVISVENYSAMLGLPLSQPSSVRKRSLAITVAR